MQPFPNYFKPINPFTNYCLYRMQPSFLSGNPNFSNLGNSPQPSIIGGQLLLEQSRIFSNLMQTPSLQSLQSNTQPQQFDKISDCKQKSNQPSPGISKIHVVSKFLAKDDNDKKDHSSLVFGKIDANEDKDESSMEFKKVSTRNQSNQKYLDAPAPSYDLSMLNNQLLMNTQNDPENSPNKKEESDASQSGTLKMEKSKSSEIRKKKKKLLKIEHERFHNKKRKLKNPEQINRLEEEYAKNPFWDFQKKLNLADELSITWEQVHKWNWDRKKKDQFAQKLKVVRKEEEETKESGEKAKPRMKMKRDVKDKELKHELEREYQKTKNLTKDQKCYLAQKYGQTFKQISKWNWDRRKKEEKQDEKPGSA